MLDRTSIISVILTVTALLWAAGFIGFSVHIKGLPNNDNSHTDAIIVLTGGPNRINAGLDLLAAKKADYLFISGVDTRVSVEQLVSLWREDVKNPPCCIILGHKAQNTFENAAEAYDWIRTNEVSSVRLLTADHHMPRARMTFAALMPGMDIHPHPVISQNVHNNLLRYLTLALREYNKTLLTWLRLHIDGMVS